ncbi:MAG: D-alanyl-D-alanine carboxypeptidase [Phormidesmis sp. RL_2_1]|nr:D-alanyl-D-alanine carboxypeptidase [Phormidesmis sp. RL_2_1]
MALGSIDIRPAWESAWIRELAADDPAAEEIVSAYLSGLSTAGYLIDEQGVWVAAGPYPMAQNQGDTLRPAASLTKIATTLAALVTWEPESHFETLVGWRGEIKDGVLTGDLVIEGGNDPLFVSEEAIALGNALEKLNIRRVTGDLIIAGDSFTMNFETSPSKSGQILKQVLNSAEWDYAISSSYQNFPPNTPKPSIQIDGQVKISAASWKDQVSGWLIRHQSLPLVAVLKAMNIYSNNPMAEQVANMVGGSAAVMSKAIEIGVMPAELSLVNGSGLGEANQMSPRAAVLMLQKIQALLQPQGYTLADIFPVTGADGGTVADRNLPANTVVKTGTLAVVSALAGAVPTAERGIVWFSLLNYGAGLDNLRSRQDQIILAIEQQWGKATETPPELRTTVNIGQAPYLFGDPGRNQPITLPPSP